MTYILRLRALLASSLLTLPIAGTAHCDLITFGFTGKVTSVSVDPDYQGFNFPDVDDPFAGSYTFDSNAPDTVGSPDQGGFTTVLPGSALRVRAGDFQFEGRAITIGTSQNYYEVGDYIPSIELTSHPALAQLLDHNNFSFFDVVAGRSQ
jgi:hypothetical protein